MSNELKLLSTKVTAGTMTRREFMSTAAALGVTAAVASTMLADAAYAAGPVKGGTTVIAFVTDPDGYKIELIQRAEGAAGAGLR